MFIHVDPTATIAQLKAKIGEVTQQETDSQKLLKDDVALTDDAKTLADLNINTDDVLALVLKRPGMMLLNVVTNPGGPSMYSIWFYHDPKLMVRIAIHSCCGSVCACFLQMVAGRKWL